MIKDARDSRVGSNFFLLLTRRHGGFGRGAYKKPENRLKFSWKPIKIANLQTLKKFNQGLLPLGPSII